MSSTIKVTPEMIAILEKAGISQAEISKLRVVPVKTKVRKKGQKPAAEYILRSIRHCKLCGTDNIKEHWMKQNPEEPHILESAKITEDTPEELPVSERYTVWKTCSCCKDYLGSLEKSTLVSMLIAEHGRKEAWLK